MCCHGLVWTVAEGRGQWKDTLYWRCYRDIGRFHKGSLACVYIGRVSLILAGVLSNRGRYSYIGMGLFYVVT